MASLWLSNLIAVSLQAALVVGAATIILGLLRISSPPLHYTLWRVVLLAVLLLPWMQTANKGPWTLDETILPDGVGGTPVVAVSQAAPVATFEWALIVITVLAAGTTLRLLWITAGLIRLRRFHDAGDEAPLLEHAELQLALGTHATVRYARGISQPATFGVRRPIVLLPVTLRSQPEARRAVLAHELVHVQRRDWLWLLVEESLRAICWFHPAVWWTITRIQLAREEVVDARAVSLAGDRRAYLRTLVSFAEQPSESPAPAFARRRHLFRRIMLLSTEDAMSARRIIASVVVVVVVLASSVWSSSAVFPMQAGGDVILGRPGPLEAAARLTSPENPVPAVVHLERATRPSNPEAADAEVSVTLRTVIDEAGQVVEVRLASFTFRRSGDPATMMGGPDVVPQFPYPVLQDFIAAAADAVRRSRYERPLRGPAVFTSIIQFTPEDTLAATRLVPMVQRVSAEGAIKIGAGMKVPVKVKDVRPVYPAAARDAGIQGIVIIETRIERDGRVGSAGVLRSIPELDQAALDAVYQWEFQPALMNGVPVPVILTVTVQFTAR